MEGRERSDRDTDLSPDLTEKTKGEEVLEVEEVMLINGITVLDP
jgi:hypothetical protein